ncbi:MAG: hypothetical protein DRI69_02025 [Bacteroidetes bacterium]|nr:MAG: hypothetical protein DRI69_02025 [Bacteroidota bacterium]
MIIEDSNEKKLQPQRGDMIIEGSDKKKLQPQRGDIIIDMRRIIYIAIITLLFAATANAQSAHKHKRSGDLMYDQGEYGVAEEEYRRANSEKTSATATYNLGNSIFQQERYDEAIRQYEQAAAITDDPLLQSRALYNLGNTYMQSQKFDKSVESYIKALKVDPNDLETKKNLTLALQQLQQQQQEQQQQQQESNEQEENDEEQEQQEQEQEEQEEGKQEEEQEPEPSEESQDELTKEEAEELLRIIEAEDQKVQEKLRKASAKPRKTKKDW